MAGTRVKVTLGCIHADGKVVTTGEFHTFSDRAEADRLVDLGVAEIVGGETKAEAKARKDAEAKAEAEAKAAEQRKADEALAVVNELGAAEEVAALSDEDLAALLKDVKK